MDTSKQQVEDEIVSGVNSDFYKTEYTPLSWALHKEDKLSAKVLIDAGAFISYENLVHPILEELILEDKSILVKALEGNNKYSHYASVFFSHFIEKDDFESVHYLLENGDVASIFDAGHEPLILCLEKGRTDTFILFLEKVPMDKEEISTVLKIIIDFGDSDLLDLAIKKLIPEENRKSHSNALDRETRPYVIKRSKIEASNEPIIEGGTEFQSEEKVPEEKVQPSNEEDLSRMTVCLGREVLYAPL